LVFFSLPPEFAGSAKIRRDSQPVAIDESVPIDDRPALTEATAGKRRT